MVDITLSKIEEM